MSLEKFLETRDPKIKNELIRENERLIYSVLQKGYNIQFLDELIQEGRLALSKAIENYNPERGGFSTLAITSIQNRFNDFFSERKRKIKLEYDDVVYFNYSVPDRVSYDRLYKAVDKLNKEEQDLICSYFPIFGNKDRRSHQRFEHHQKNKAVAKLAKLYKSL